MVGFKAHDEKHGDRLGRQVALGGVGMARRYVESGAIGEPERPVAERREVARAAVAMATEVRRGRPSKGGVKPWELEGVSKATWYRRKKAEVGGG